MDRAKALARLKKCLALSKSPEPHEAAAAMRQAQKLMEAFGLEQSDVERAEYGNEKVSCPIACDEKLPYELTYLLDIIKRAFGVSCVVEREMRVSQRSWAVRYFGPMSRIQLAAYTHTVLYRAMRTAWTVYLAAHPNLKGVRGARLGFFDGWLQAIQFQVDALAMTDDEKCNTDLVKANYYGHDLVPMKSGNTRVLDSTVNAGHDAGSAFALHRPMQADKLKLTR